jgi:hypothetical protein
MQAIAKKKLNRKGRMIAKERKLFPLLPSRPLRWIFG